MFPAQMFSRSAAGLHLKFLIKYTLLPQTEVQQRRELTRYV